jgi:hypothetical protein
LGTAETRPDATVQYFVAYAVEAVDLRYSDETRLLCLV